VNGWRTQMAEMDSEAEVASTYKGDWTSEDQGKDIVK
jgi:hypothetical protein